MNTTLLLVLIGLFFLIALRQNLFHCSAYSASLGNVTDTDTTFANDLILGFRNNHLLLTDDFNPIALYGSGSNLARMRFNNAQLLQYGIPHIWPLDTVATPPDLPAVMDLRDQILDFPINEEIIVQSTTTAVGPQQITLWMWLAANNWNRQLSPYIWKGTVRATVTTPAGSAGGFSTPTNLVFERDLRNGVYEIFGAEVFQATGFGFRLRLPDQTSVYGKQIRPGGLVQSAVGNEPWLPQRGALGGLGIWGRFHTFTPPQLEMFGDAAGGTAEVRLQLGYVGEDRNLVFGVPGKI